jgi:hypothetical protein
MLIGRFSKNVTNIFSYVLNIVVFLLSCCISLDASMQNQQIDKPSQDNPFLVNDLFSNKFLIIL